MTLVTIAGLKVVISVENADLEITYILPPLEAFYGRVMAPGSGTQLSIPHSLLALSPSSFLSNHHFFLEHVPPGNTLV